MTHAIEGRIPNCIKVSESIQLISIPGKLYYPLKHKINPNWFQNDLMHQKIFQSFQVKILLFKTSKTKNTVLSLFVFRNRAAVSLFLDSWSTQRLFSDHRVPPYLAIFRCYLQNFPILKIFTSVFYFRGGKQYFFPNMPQIWSSFRKK